MSRGRSATTTKVFVGSLPADVTTEDLRKLFEPYGAIAECDIANRCGFLHMEDRDLAMKAISELNGVDFMGAKISVEKGRVRPRRTSGGGGPVRGGGRGSDRGGPYSRGGGDFRGGPPRNGGYSRDPPPFRGSSGGFDRMPQRGGYGMVMDDRRAMGYGGGMDDRRVSGGYDDRRPGGYPDRYGDASFGSGVDRRYDDRPMSGGLGGGYSEYDDRRGGYDDRRPQMSDRRNLVEPSSRGPPAAAADLFSRRDAALPKTGYGDRGYGGGAGTNGFGGGAAAAGSYGDRSGYGAGYGGGAVRSTGYGDSYGGASASVPAVSGRYDNTYPPLPAQRSFASGTSGGPGTRREVPLGGRRF